MYLEISKLFARMAVTRNSNCLSSLHS